MWTGIKWLPIRSACIQHGKHRCRQKKRRIQKEERKKQGNKEAKSNNGAANIDFRKKENSNVAQYEKNTGSNNNDDGPFPT